MSADLNSLVPEFRPGVDRLLSACVTKDVEMRPNETLRTPLDQGRLWRQSRTIEVIRRKIDELRGGGAPFLAQCLEQAGPQHGDHVTNAPPGVSWHQWGEAIDCVWIVNGDEEWSTERKVNGFNGYQVYAAVARELGFEAGGLWREFKDWPHVQSRPQSSPLEIYTLPEIDAVMRQRFGH